MGLTTERRITETLLYLNTMAYLFKCKSRLAVVHLTSIEYRYSVLAMREECTTRFAANCVYYVTQRMRLNVSVSVDFPTIPGVIYPKLVFGLTFSYLG